ncbi:CCA tRNA nucleotidyltransferase [Sphingomonas sp. 1P06PA]|uniref:CCA tRNA nucleotidyltransferase n=1 Tax=Sphingomonas sp. 1P06PA TaxID=554121 RepID=UPI0039A47056
MTRLPAAAWRDRAGLSTLLDALGAAAGATRFVGGAVRDTLLGLPVSDVDLATRLLPDDVLRRVKAIGVTAVPTGIAHGTVTAVLPGGAVEVTTLRRDVATDGRHATVAFTDDWQADAARRDFTINALSADPASGAVFDYFGGLDDLAARTVRFIGDPRDRIAEDHLRILRFFRFHARFGRGDPEPAGLAACAERANDLMALSRERIADELLKLLALPDPTSTVRLMHHYGLFAPILPEIEPAGIDRLGRLIAAETAACAIPDPVRRLAALLPDDPDRAERTVARLKQSRVRQRRVRQAATPIMPDESIDAIAYARGADAAIDRLLIEGRSEQAQALAGWQRPQLPLSGGALIAAGLAPGPIVAATLQAIERRWVAEAFPDGERFAAIVADALDQARSAQ